MIDQAKYIAERANIRECERGGCCVFVPMNPLWGIKIYKDKDIRDESYEFQEHASRYKLGPHVGGKFEAVTKWAFLAGKSYCLLTERAELNRSIPNGECSKLEKELLKIGIENYDIRNRNTGWIDNRVVCIDFSHCYWKD